jgi:hypothetical protein
LAEVQEVVEEFVVKGGRIRLIIRKEKRTMAKQPGLDNRHRDKSGQTREKNGNTRVGTLRETYGDNFAPGRRSDMKLDNLLEETGSSSLSEYLRNQKK